MELYMSTSLFWWLSHLIQASEVFARKFQSKNRKILQQIITMLFSVTNH